MKQFFLSTLLQRSINILSQKKVMWSIKSVRVKVMWSREVKNKVITNLILGLHINLGGCCLNLVHP